MWSGVWVCVWVCGCVCMVVCVWVWVGVVCVRVRVWMNACIDEINKKLYLYVFCSSTIL